MFVVKELSEIPVLVREKYIETFSCEVDNVPLDINQAVRYRGLSLDSFQEIWVRDFEKDSLFMSLYHSEKIMTGQEFLIECAIYKLAVSEGEYACKSPDAWANVVANIVVFPFNGDFLFGVDFSVEWSSFELFTSKAWIAPLERNDGFIELKHSYQTKIDAMLCVKKLLSEYSLPNIEFSDVTDTHLFCFPHARLFVFKTKKWEIRFDNMPIYEFHLLTCFGTVSVREEDLSEQIGIQNFYLGTQEYSLEDLQGAFRSIVNFFGAELPDPYKTNKSLVKHIYGGILNKIFGKKNFNKEDYYSNLWKDEIQARFVVKSMGG